MIDIDWEFITEIVANIATFGALVVSLVALFITVRAYYQSGLPQIVVHIEADPDKNVFLFIVENTGKGVAFELSFSEIDSSIYDEKTVNYIKDTFIERGIPILVPGGIRSTVISGPSGKLLESKASPVVVSYYVKGFIRSRKKMQETFILDYSSLIGSLIVKSDNHQVKIAIEKIEKDLREIAKAIYKLN